MKVETSNFLERLTARSSASRPRAATRPAFTPDLIPVSFPLRSSRLSLPPSFEADERFEVHEENPARSVPNPGYSDAGLSPGKISSPDKVEGTGLKEKSDHSASRGDTLSPSAGSPEEISPDNQTRPAIPFPEPPEEEAAREAGLEEGPRQPSNEVSKAVRGLAADESAAIAGDEAAEKDHGQEGRIRSLNGEEYFPRPTPERSDTPLGQSPAPQARGRGAARIRPEIERATGPRKAEKSSRAPKLAGWKPKSHAQERFLVERPAEGEEPTVNIHIGRIEVRAIMPPPPPVPKAEPAPPLSLAEYLKRRRQETR